MADGPGTRVVHRRPPLSVCRPSVVVVILFVVVVVVVVFGCGCGCGRRQRATRHGRYDDVPWLQASGPRTCKKPQPRRCTRFASGSELGTPDPDPRHPYPRHRGLAQTRALP
jgi:hypothetical protein